MSHRTYSKNAGHWAARHLSGTNRPSPSYNARLPSCANGLSTREHPMPLNVPITEEMVRGLAPDDATWNKATELAGSERLVNAGVSADGTWLLADAKGAGKD